MEENIRNGSCNNIHILKTWLSQCILCIQKPKEFKNRITIGKIVHHLYEELRREKETFSEWLDRVLINHMGKINCCNVDPFILFNRISLQTNTIIRIFQVEPSDFTKPCTSQDHKSSCCYIEPYFISAVANLSESNRKLLTFIIDPLSSHAVRFVDLLEFEKVFKFRESDHKQIFNKEEFASYLREKYHLTQPPVLNFRSEVNEHINVHIYVSYGFVNESSLQSAQIEYIGSWGKTQNPDIYAIILSSYSTKRYILLDASKFSLKTTVKRYMNHVQINPTIQRKYPQKKFTDEQCPCEQIPHVAKTNLKKHCKPVGHNEQDFTHTLKMLALFEKKEQDIVLACSRLSILSYDIER